MITRDKETEGKRAEKRGEREGLGKEREREKGDSHITAQTQIQLNQHLYYFSIIQFAQGHCDPVMQAHRVERKRESQCLHLATYIWKYYLAQENHLFMQ